jgi:hypothetical protein
MKGTTISDTVFSNTEELFQVIEFLRSENQNLKTENQLLKVFIGK